MPSLCGAPDAEAVLHVLMDRVQKYAAWCASPCSFLKPVMGVSLRVCASSLCQQSKCPQSPLRRGAMLLRPRKQPPQRAREESQQ